jgi:biopolymer transport protein ExbD
MRGLNRTRRSRRQEVEIPELNVTPFMNLMIVLVPVLLLSLVFTHTTVIELDFPGQQGVAASNEDLHLEVRILADQLVVADQRGVVKSLPKIDGVHDFVGLNLTMQAIKQRMPDKRNAMILLEAKTDYQALVFTMDSIRAYDTTQDGVAIYAELFPDVALGDVKADTAIELASGGSV